jgi:hydroxyacylglutathione hydrolase
MAVFSDDVVFYPGHDYAARNASWILSVEPDNQRAAILRTQASSRLRSEGPWLHTLGVERAMNPFFRVDDPALRAHLAATGVLDRVAASGNPAETAFRALRADRDQF